MQSELQEFLDLAKAELIRANQDRRHPFRLCTLATQAHYPAQRTVVKRKTMSDLSTLIYTDERSTKVKQLKKDKHCSQLYYHPKKKLQVTISGTAHIITEGDLYETHRLIAMKHPGDYTAEIPPGTNIGLKNYEKGERDYFTLLVIEPKVVEVLSLGKEKHERAQFIPGEEWMGSWMVP